MRRVWREDGLGGRFGDGLTVSRAGGRSPRPAGTARELMTKGGAASAPRHKLSSVVCAGLWVHGHAFLRTG